MKDFVEDLYDWFMDERPQDPPSLQNKQKLHSIFHVWQRVLWKQACHPRHPTTTLLFANMDRNPSQADHHVQEEEEEQGMSQWLAEPLPPTVLYSLFELVACCFALVSLVNASQVKSHIATWTKILAYIRPFL